MTILGLIAGGIAFAITLFIWQEICIFLFNWFQETSIYSWLSEIFK